MRHYPRSCGQSVVMWSITLATVLLCEASSGCLQRVMSGEGQVRVCKAPIYSPVSCHPKIELSEECAVCHER